MKHYYINPIGGHLVIHDTETKELVVVERIESVRVFLGGEVRLGDFDGHNPKNAVDEFDEGGGYENTHSPPPGSLIPRGQRRNFRTKHTEPGTPEPRKRKTAMCKVCGKPGRADYHGHSKAEGGAPAEE